MALITEEIWHDELYAKLVTINRAIDEDIEDWRFIRLAGCGGDRYTPAELISLGRWLIEQGSRIEKEYNSSGAKK